MHPEKIFKELRKAVDAVLGALDTALGAPAPVPIRIKAERKPPRRP